MPQPVTPPAEEKTAAERQIARAQSLYREMKALQGKIDANRKYLRLMRDNDELTPAQSKWLDHFYGTKQPGGHRTEEDLAASAAAKAEALKG